MSIKTYNTIHTLPLFNFYQYEDNKDLNWFIIGYDGRQKKIIDKSLEEIRIKIIDELYTEFPTAKLVSNLKKEDKITELKLKYNVLNSIIIGFSVGFENSIEGQNLRLKYIEILKDYRIKFPIMNSPSEDMKELIKIRSQLENINTQIKIIQDELKTDTKTQKQSLNKQLRRVAVNLGQKDVSNPKEITVAQWFADLEIEREILEKN